jgi:hypothetical protein
MANEPDASAFVFVAMSGEQQRGSDGCVWVDRANGLCRYVLVDELKSAELRDGVRDMLTADGDANYFIVFKQEKSAHVTKFPKAMARQVLAQSQQ